MNNNKIKKATKCIAFLALVAVVVGFCPVSVMAAADSPFTIDAQILPSDKQTYDILITVENQGENWEGIARLMINGIYGGASDCAYDTILSLPQGSTKQFTVKVPKSTLERTDGVVKVTLVENGNEKTVWKEFPRLLQNGAEGILMGILSDAYSSLTYLDMGGRELYYYNSNYPIRLLELNQDNLKNQLSSLTILVIDNFHTNVLDNETVEAVKQWTDNGGVLIVGTGSYVEETLGGLDYLEVESRKVSVPSEEDKDMYGSSYMHALQYLPQAQLIDKNGIYEEDRYNLMLRCTQGDGAVGILPYSLQEFSSLGADAFEDRTRGQEDYVESILDSICGYASVRYGNGQSSYNYDGTYTIVRLLRLLGNGSGRLEFGSLQWLIVLYVIFIGPVLYLILRFAKKRDWYWIAVPVTALVGIFLVYWAGRGFEVVSTNVFSVTVENLADTQNAITYLHCYDAGHKEWDLRLAQGYEYASAAPRNYYVSSTDEKYYYRVQKEGDRISIGINPNTGFEDGYFQASIAKEPEGGSLSLNKDGTISNLTGHDFTYIAIVKPDSDSLQIYKNLPTGETVALSQLEQDYYGSLTGPYGGSIMSEYLYSYMDDNQKWKNSGNKDIVAALGLGIASVYTQEAAQNGTLVIGVTPDWDKVIDDICSEVSYRCLYAVMGD